MIMIVHSANGRALDNRVTANCILIAQTFPAQSGFQSEIGRLLWHDNNEQCAPQVPGAVRQQIPFPSQPAGKNAVVWQHASPPPPPAVVVYLLEARQDAEQEGRVAPSRMCIGVQAWRYTRLPRGCREHTILPLFDM